MRIRNETKSAESLGFMAEFLLESEAEIFG
jgi:hypothetical protein